MDEDEWAPEGVDVTTPSVARLYDYYLGGKDNYASDRAAAEQLLSKVPEVRTAARANRAFLGRAVRHLAGAGVDQFLDIGTGLPTRGNVHEVAHEVNPGARVVYTDNDPMVLTHGRALLAASQGVTIVAGDLRRPAEILRNRRVLQQIDFSRPVAVLLVAILHFVPDEAKPAEIIATLRDALPAGSHLVLSHGTRDVREEAVDQGTEVYKQASAQLALRTRAEIRALFDGFDLLPPGLVWLPQWRPDDGADLTSPEQSLIVGGVGRKTAP